MQQSVPRFLLAAAALLVFTSPLRAQSAPSSKEPVATIGGQPIYEQDIFPLMEGQLNQLRAQEYEIKRRALDSVITQKLLDAEAKKRNISVEALLQLDVDSKIADPSKEEVESIYNAQKDRIGRPLDEIREQLKQAIKKARAQDAREEYFASLRDKAGVEVLLNPPRVDVTYDASRVRGKPDAPVTIIEFSDFQCPFCQRAYQTVMEVLAKYDGRVKLAYRDYPLREIHPDAEGAAEAGRCVADQGKFWEFHDRIFSTASNVDRETLLKHVKELKLDEERFIFCLDSGKHRQAIEQDLKAGAAAGVSGTPAFFIDGIFLSGAQPVSAFEKVIDAVLAEKQRAAKQTADVQTVPETK